MDSMKVTDRLTRILTLAKTEMNKLGHHAIHPGHLLLGILQEKSGALGEIVLKGNFDHELIRRSLMEQAPAKAGTFFHFPLTAETEAIIKSAAGTMKRYNQIFLNEGHVIKSLLASGAAGHLLSKEDRQLLYNLGTTARDMIAHLGGYSFPELKAHHIRKAVKEDTRQLLDFVKSHFSGEWAETVEAGLDKDTPTVYIAFGKNGEIIGFAAFDSYKNKKGYFGPMGVSASERSKGAGYALLHHCLRDMKELGYEYAIIGGAGPLEFYEKACNAVVIPSFQ